MKRMTVKLLREKIENLESEITRVRDMLECERAICASLKNRLDNASVANLRIDAVARNHAAGIADIRLASGCPQGADLVSWIRHLAAEHGNDRLATTGASAQ